MERTGHILIADAGGTSINWALTSAFGPAIKFESAGMNASLCTEEEIVETIRAAFSSFLEISIDEGFFYGAGCVPGEPSEKMERAIKRALPIMRHRPIEVRSDMLAAARATCGDAPGVVCILGTGSNSCQYDGKQIVRGVRPLGYVLGDEGSGACIGKRLLAARFRGRLPEEVEADFDKAYSLTEAQMIQHVYREPGAQAWLAEFAKFAAKHLDIPEVRLIVMNELARFFDQSVLQYDRNLPVHFVGSIAYYFSDLIHEIAECEGVTVGKILKSPLNELIEYHLEKCNENY